MTDINPVPVPLEQSPATASAQAVAAVPVKTADQPITQQKRVRRSKWPEWAKQLPYPQLPPADPNFQLIKQDDLTQILAHATPESKARIQADMQVLERELMTFFRENDARAAYQQNRFRLYQIGYIGLATLATIAGSLQAVLFSGNPDIVPFFAFIETIIALIATYMATLSARQPAYPAWMDARRKSETLRREYFRFLLNLAPYDHLKSYERRLALADRAANINRGTFPEDS